MEPEQVRNAVTSKPNGAESKQQAVVNAATAAPQETKAPSEPQEVTITLSARAIAAVNAVIRRAPKRNMTTNFEHWAEELLVTGSTAQCRSWDYSDKNVNLREYEKAKALLDYADPRFVEKLKALDAKYGIGGTRIEVK